MQRRTRRCRAGPVKVALQAVTGSHPAALGAAGSAAVSLSPGVAEVNLRDGDPRPNVGVVLDDRQHSRQSLSENICCVDLGAVQPDVVPDDGASASLAELAVVCDEDSVHPGCVDGQLVVVLIAQVCLPCSPGVVPEPLEGRRDVGWDVVIAEEAHNLSGNGSSRCLHVLRPQ